MSFFTELFSIIWILASDRKENSLKRALFKQQPFKRQRSLTLAAHFIIYALILLLGSANFAFSQNHKQIPKDFTYPESPEIIEIQTPFCVKSISGIVTDSVGAVMSEVLVEQVSEDQKTRISAVFTNDRGLFSFKDLPTGKYFLKFSLPGFGTTLITIVKNRKGKKGLKIVLQPSA
jgi:hypothetical protein